MSFSDLKRVFAQLSSFSLLIIQVLSALSPVLFIDMKRKMSSFHCVIAYIAKIISGRLNHLNFISVECSIDVLDTLSPNN